MNHQYHYNLKKNGDINYINIDSIYILHYANSFEIDDNIIIYGCVYDNFDFFKAL